MVCSNCKQIIVKNDYVKMILLLMNSNEVQNKLGLLVIVIDVWMRGGG